MRFFIFFTCWLFLGFSCSASKKVVKDETGVYRLIRRESKDASGVIDIELWSKDGVPTNKYVYMKRTLYNGDKIFVRVEP